MRSLVTENVVALAMEAATVSQDLLVEAFLAPDLISAAGEDIKLGEDKRSEALIVELLRAKSDWAILSEEIGWVGSVPSPVDPYWVIDPLDGSYNFHAGIPLFAVSIAVCIGSQPILGCVNDVLRSELFVGGKTMPLQINGQLASGSERPGRKILSSGLPVARTTTSLPVEFRSGRWSKLRMLGSASLSLAWTASGRLGGYEERGIRWWDVAGGIALVHAAKGNVQIGLPRSEDFFDPTCPLDVVAFGEQSI